jgi:hypothetical protein
VLVTEHPIAFFSPPPPPAAQERLRTCGEAAAVFDPFVEGARVGDAVFDPADAFYVPLTGQLAVARPGPRVTLYRCPVAP